MPFHRYYSGRQPTKEETMKLEEIKKAVDEGKHVKWSNKLYDVVKDNLGQYFIICNRNNYAIGLTWTDGVTLNGRPSEFYIAKRP